MLEMKVIIRSNDGMIDDLRTMAIFAETITQGSFSGASKALGLSPSVVSYHVTQLEKRLGVALIYRSTRKLSLTHEGKVLYQHARDMLNTAQTGLSSVMPDTQAASGKLCITLPSVSARAMVTQKIAEFSRRYPNVELDLRYTDKRQDIIAQGIDLALRAGDMPDSGLKSRHIENIHRTLVCSSDYYGSRAEPATPEDLTDWDWIRLKMLPPSRTFTVGDNQRVDVQFATKITVDDVDAMTQLSINGLGLATPPIYLVEKEIDQGTLVHVLPEWSVEPLPLYAVWPANVTNNSLTKRFLNFL